MKAIRDQQGFTLIEVLIVTVILGIIMAALFGVLISTQRVSNFNREQLDLQQEAIIFLLNLSKDIRRSLAISTPSAIPANSQLRLELDIDGTGTTNRTVTYTWDTTNNQIVYNLLSGTGNNKIFLRDIVEDLDFDNTSTSGLVEVTLKLKQGQATYTVSDRIYPRSND